MSRSVYVGNLPYTVNQEEVREIFSRDGRKVVSVNLIMDRETGRPRGFGFVEMSSEKEAEDFFQSNNWMQYNHVRICGLMGMATFTDDNQQIRLEFKSLKRLFDSIKTTSMSEVDSFNQLSMGMSGDFQIGIEEGSTLVRVGSAIFGDRH